jgi:hypothetical protein
MHNYRKRKYLHYNPDDDVRAIGRLTQGELKVAKYWANRQIYLERNQIMVCEPLFVNFDINLAIDGLVYLYHRSKTNKKKYSRKGRRVK